MDYKIKKLPKSEIAITITVSPEILQSARKRAYEEISKEVKIKGFRPGHIPAHILEQNIDQKYLSAYTQEKAIQKSYAEVVVKEKLQVVSRPKVNIENEDPLTFTATVSVLPEIEISDYKSIKVKKQEVKVTPEDVQEVINNLQKYSTTYHDVDREIQKGDRAEIDFEGFEGNGEAIPGTQSKNHPLIVGDNTLVPGFEDQLIGMKKEETKEFDVTFPNDYHKEDFRKKKVHFKVKVGRIEEAKKQELNEEFVEKITGKKQTIDELKKEIEENIKNRKDQEAEQKQESQYLEELLKKIKTEIPDSLIDEEVYYILEDIKDDIGQKGIEFEKFLAQANTTEEKLHEKYRPEAERRIKVRLAINYMIQKEEIKVTDDELNTEFQKSKSMYPKVESEKMQQEFDKGHLKTQLRNRLAINKLFAKVLA